MADIEKHQRQLFEQTRKVMLLRGGRALNPNQPLDNEKDRDESHRKLQEMLTECRWDAFPFEYGLMMDVLAKHAAGETSRLSGWKNWLKNINGFGGSIDIPDIRANYEVAFSGQPGNIQLQSLRQTYANLSHEQPFCTLLFNYLDNSIAQAYIWYHFYGDDSTPPKPFDKPDILPQPPNPLNDIIRNTFRDTIFYVDREEASITLNLTPTPSILIRQAIHSLPVSAKHELTYNFTPGSTPNFEGDLTTKNYNFLRVWGIKAPERFTLEDYRDLFKGMLSMIDAVEVEITS